MTAKDYDLLNCSNALIPQKVNYYFNCSNLMKMKQFSGFLLLLGMAGQLEFPKSPEMNEEAMTREEENKAILLIHAFLADHFASLISS